MLVNRSNGVVVRQIARSILNKRVNSPLTKLKVWVKVVKLTRV